MLSIQSGANGVLVVGAGAVLLVFAIWLLKHLPTRTPLRLSSLIAVVMLLAVAYSPSQLSTAQATTTAPVVTEEPSGNFESYSAAKLEAYREEGPVFVNFTAAWCVTCKVNEAVALSTTDTMNMMTKKDALPEG